MKTFTRVCAVPTLALSIASIASACAESGAQSGGTRLHWSQDTLLVDAQLLRDLSSTAPDNDVIGRALSIRAAGTTLFVADASADRIAVLDSAAQIVRWIGKRGHGPGELFGAAYLALRDSTLFVGEALNGRVSAFTTAGQFIRSFSSPYAAGQIGATATNVYSIARSETRYARLLNDDADPPLTFARADATTSLVQRARDHVFPGYDLIATDSNRTWIFDQAHATICEFRDGLTSSRCLSLPKALGTRLRGYADERIAALEASRRIHVSSAMLAKDMIRVGTWLAILLPLPELPIVLVDPDDASLTPVVNLRGALPPWLRGARSFAWDGRSFVVIGDDGIGRVSVARRPTSE